MSLSLEPATLKMALSRAYVGCIFSSLSFETWIYFYSFYDMNLLKTLSSKVKMDSRKVKIFAEKISPLKKSHKVASEIGSPTNFKHVVHIGTDSSHADVAEVPKKVR